MGRSYRNVDSGEFTDNYNDVARFWVMRGECVEVILNGRVIFTFNNLGI